MHNERIVNAARGWIGTRFSHQGRVKKNDKHAGGVDCLGLLAGVAQELDLRLEDNTPLINFDSSDYSHYPDTVYLRQRLAQLLDEIELSQMAAGDILLLKIDNSPQHLAIVSNMAGGNIGIIHAYAPARKVVEHTLDSWWIKRIESVFRVK